MQASVPGKAREQSHVDMVNAGVAPSNHLCGTPGSQRKRIAYFCIGLVAAFFVGDRLIARLPLPVVSGSVNAPRQKLELYQNATRTPDAAFLGISYTLFGVRPDRIDAAASTALGRSVRTLNLAAEGHTILAQAIMARRLMDMTTSGSTQQEADRQAASLPQVLYFGISPDAIDASQLEALRRTIRSLGGFYDQSIIAHAPVSLMADAIATQSLASYHQWHDSRLITQRMIKAAPLTHAGKTRDDLHGWRAWIGETKRSTLSGANHNLEATVLDDDRGFGIETINGQILCRVIEELKERNVAVRLLELPVSSTAPPHKRRAGNQPYLSFVEMIHRRTGAPIIRPPAHLLSDQDYFDHGHLLPSGAAKLSAWLATDVVRTLEQLNSNNQTDLADSLPAEDHSPAPAHRRS